MARIRYIKPEVSLDEELATKSLHARLFFRDLWCHCDRAGRAEDRPMRLKALIFPWDNVDADALLQELTPHFIIRYELDGKRYLQVRNWTKHQRPHVREAESTYPAPPRALIKHCLGTAQAMTSTLDNGDGDGDGDGENNRAPSAVGQMPSLKAFPEPELRVPWGPHRGRRIADLPIDTCEHYLNDKKTSGKFRAAFQARLNQKKSEMTPAQLKARNSGRGE